MDIQPVPVAFLIIPYIAERPICTFLAIGQRLNCTVFTHVTNITLTSMDNFPVLNIILMLYCTNGCVTLSCAVLHFRLLRRCLASNINYSHAGFKNMAASDGNLHSNQKTERQKIAKTDLVQHVHIRFIRR